MKVLNTDTATLPDGTAHAQLRIAFDNIDELKSWFAKSGIPTGEFDRHQAAAPHKSTGEPGGPDDGRVADPNGPEGAQPAEANAPAIIGSPRERSTVPAFGFPQPADPFAGPGRVGAGTDDSGESKP
ncbi:MAG: hypothetical protein ACRD9W_04570 [Terriglobia bacterium]